MPFPRWLARVNLHITNRVLGPLARRIPRMGVVIHEGRKSRHKYQTPVMVFRRGNRCVIALTYGRDSQWVQNVLAANGCELEIRYCPGYRRHHFLDYWAGANMAYILLCGSSGARMNLCGAHTHCLGFWFWC